MAKNNDKRAERMARSNRNVNRAITVLMAGVIAEFYLLMVNNYYVKGGVGQVLDDDDRASRSSTTSAVRCSARALSSG